MWLTINRLNLKVAFLNYFGIRLTPLVALVVLVRKVLKNVPPPIELDQFTLIHIRKYNPGMTPNMLSTVSAASIVIVS